MKNLRYTLMLLLAGATCQAQSFNLRSVIKPGTQLIYTVEAGGKTYNFVVTIKDLAGKNFDWKMGEPVNKSGRSPTPQRVSRTAMCFSTISAVALRPLIIERPVFG